MGTVLHLLRSCIAGRGLWGKPFNGEIIPDGNTLVAALNSLKACHSWMSHVCKQCHAMLEKEPGVSQVGKESQ